MTKTKFKKVYANLPEIEKEQVIAVKAMSLLLVLLSVSGCGILSVDYAKEACSNITEGIASMGCNRYINCSKFKEGCEEIWYGNPNIHNPGNAELEYTTCKYNENKS